MHYLIELNYTAELPAIDLHLQAHRQWLQHHYEQGHFMMAGAKQPRTGGLILARADHEIEVQEWIGSDPFKQHGLAEYRVTAWQISTQHPALTLPI
ncbi:YciI family protein [Limnobacter sp.]|uniref:YciI family protein n=1 Tax=Limnobacter sp. TaxID=2003368 RepID=UPI00258DB8A1|nr:YciI family protein [Limnobacter sp.]